MTLPKMTHLKNKCNIVVIDGDHSRVDNVYADIVNFRDLAHPQHVVIMDDTPGMSAVDAAWERGKQKGLMRELFRCRHSNLQTGISIGMYEGIGINK